MEIIRSTTLKKLVKIVEKVADAKIQQGILLKELTHSIRTHQKDKSLKEWKEFVFKALSSMNEKEAEVLNGIM